MTEQKEELCILVVGWRRSANFQGEGFNCRTNKTSGDGEWSNVAAQRKWIENRLIPGAGKGVTFLMVTKLRHHPNCCFSYIHK